MKNLLHQSFLAALAASLLIAPCYALPKHEPVPGGISVLALAPLSAQRPIAHFKGQRVTVIAGEKHWVALVGIPLKTKPGIHQMQMIHPVNQKRFTLDIPIKGKDYRTQRLTIRNKNLVNPSKKSTQRIIRELQQQKKLKTVFSPQAPQLEFIYPLKGLNTGRFGLRRFINGQARSPHSGMDIAAPQGTPIKSPAQGRVIYTGNFFFTGNVVYIDHGSGLISLYAHLNRIRAKNGAYLKQGQVLGEVGKTGRATGPHLHWSVYLNGQAVDPSLFLDD